MLAEFGLGVLIGVLMALIGAIIFATYVGDI